MFRLLLILALALPASAIARPAKGGKGARNRAPAARNKAPARNRAAARNRAPVARNRNVTRNRNAHTVARSRQRGRVNTRVVVQPTGRAMRAPREPSRLGNSRRGRHHGHYRRPAPRYRYGRRPRYRPVVVIIDHHLVYDRIARAERRMSRLERRAAGMQDWRDRQSLEYDAADMRSEIAALDRDSDRIRSWYHWERSQARIHRLRRRLGVVQGDLAAGPLRRQRPAPAARRAPARPAGAAISEARFGKIEFELESSSFRDDKLAIVRRVAAAHWFTSAQARAIARQIHHSDDRVEALRLLHPRVVDPENFQTVYDTLPARQDREALDAVVYSRF